jgi:class 3 adenylate cyclase
MIEAVRRYTGYVVQSTGGSIFALFGAPLVHEDHSQRSLYAVLRMQKELSGYSAKVVADGGMPIEARAGVNTDEVVVRSIRRARVRSIHTDRAYHQSRLGRRPRRRSVQSR